VLPGNLKGSTTSDTSLRTGSTITSDCAGLGGHHTRELVLVADRGTHRCALGGQTALAPKRCQGVLSCAARGYK
jgi:hypothetical protein